MPRTSFVLLSCVGCISGATQLLRGNSKMSRHPLPKGRGLCFVAVSISEETSYVCSTEGPQAALKMFIAAFMSLSW